MQGTNEVCGATVEEKSAEFDREAPNNSLFQIYVYPKPRPDVSQHRNLALQKINAHTLSSFDPCLSGGLVLALARGRSGEECDKRKRRVGLPTSALAQNPDSAKRSQAVVQRNVHSAAVIKISLVG